MHDTANRKDSAIWPAALILLILVILTLGLLVGKLQAKEPDAEFVLLPEEYYDFLATEDEVKLQITAPKQTLPPNPRPHGDADTPMQWVNMQQYNLFNPQYFTRNGTNSDGYNYDVQSANGDDVIAPGTESSYTINLLNPGTRPAKYWVFVRTDWEEPDKERCDDGASPRSLPFELAAGDYGFENVNQYYNSLYPGHQGYGRLVASGSLGASLSKTYTINWKWPFERSGNKDNPINDETTIYTYDPEDMMLAALADATHTVTVTVLSEEDTDVPPTPTPTQKPNGGGGGGSGKGWSMPQTGDSFNAMLWICVGLAGLAGVVLVLTKAGFITLPMRRRKTEEDKNEDNK